MSKAIKVEDHVYKSLTLLRGEKETYSDVISHLLQARVKAMEFFSVLEGSLKFRGWEEDKLAGIVKSRLERLESRTAGKGKRERG